MDGASCRLPRFRSAPAILRASAPSLYRRRLRGSAVGSPRRVAARSVRVRPATARSGLPAIGCGRYCRRGRRGKDRGQMALHGRRENRMIRPTQEEVVMPQRSGRWIPMSPARRFIADLVYSAKGAALHDAADHSPGADGGGPRSLHAAARLVRPVPQGLRDRRRPTAAIALGLHAAALAAFLRASRKRRQRHHRTPHRRRGRRSHGARAWSAEPDAGGPGGPSAPLQDRPDREHQPVPTI